MDVGDYGEVAIRAEGVVGVLIGGAGRAMDFVVAVGESRRLSTYVSLQKSDQCVVYPSSWRIIATFAPLEEPGLLQKSTKPRGSVTTLIVLDLEYLAQ